ncbi:hypothetical protein HY214_01970 [Candidatus Roizmanbacteria bacterium]|nr:hypothetical protein [Candidatus Roizmanbacteria bacterium]
MLVKERRTKILLALFLFSDVNFHEVIFDERVKKVLDLSFNQKTRGTLSALIKDGLIEKTADKENQYRLTDNGFLKLCLHFPFFRFLKHSWDVKSRRRTAIFATVCGGRCRVGVLGRGTDLSG